MANRREDMNPEQFANDRIKEAELSKARVYEVPGKVAMVPLPLDASNNFVHSAMVDEKFLLVAAHIDENTRKKIIDGQYIDFLRLRPKDKVIDEEEGRMQLVQRNGHTYFVPVQEGTSILNYGKWEQAFRVFSDIYTRAHPHRSGELIQYNHIIHTISHMYVWDNVYKYDKDFRMHLNQFPQRSWAIILNQAWAMRLKDKIRMDNTRNMTGGFGNSGRQGSQDPCRHYNRGKCTFGVNCKFDHKCSYCHRFRHTVKNCRKLAADRAAGKFDGAMSNSPSQPIQELVQTPSSMQSAGGNSGGPVRK